MKKALILSSLTLVLVLCACIADDLVLSRRCEDWTRQLTAVETAVAAEDWPAAQTAMDDLRQDWDHWQAYLHIIINHEAISEAEALIETCRLSTHTRDGDMFWEHDAPLRCQFTHIAELEQLSIKNVL